MNKKAAFIIAGSILLLVVQSHRTYAADTSVELFAAIKSGDTAKVGQLLATGSQPQRPRPGGSNPADIRCARRQSRYRQTLGGQRRGR